MKMNFCQELIKIAKLFPPTQPLYAVGGCVRDFILDENFDIKNVDIDLASSVTPAQLDNIFSGSGYEIVKASERLGTIIIKGIRSYEYTTFRVDSYPNGSGEHTPSEVFFCDDIALDAQRRDFKCNAVYYNILEESFVDPLQYGIQQIKEKILETTISPSQVLGQDGLRIMRLFRFVSTLDFDIEANTYQSVVELKDRLKDISIERIAVELEKLLQGKNCYKALCLMRDSGVLQVILPVLMTNDKTPQNPKYHKYDVLEHIFRVTQNCPPSIRMAGLMHDIAKTYCQNKYGNMYLHAQIGSAMCQEILEKYRYSKKFVDTMSRLVKEHMYDINNNTKEGKLRLFIAQNFDIMDNLLALKKADFIGAGMNPQDYVPSNLQIVYEQMKKENAPINIKQLAINGSDLQNLGVEGKQIGEILENVFVRVVKEKLPNQKDFLLQWITKLYKLGE